MSENEKTLQETQKKEQQPHAGQPCPHCGYCPHCGRGGWPVPQYYFSWDWFRR
jgi:hypothetical protein